MRSPFLVVLALCALPGPAARAKPETDPSMEATRHYQLARALYDARSYAAAALEFKQSYQLVPRPSLLFNRAKAYAMAGELEKAVICYRKYVESAPAGEAAQEARDEIARLSTAIAKRSPAPPVAEAVRAAAPAPAPVPTRQPCSDLATCVDACLAKDAESCRRAGQLTETAPGGDAHAAADLFREGCELGDAVACLSGGRLYHEGAGVTKDAARALELYRRACEKGQADACGRVATLLADEGRGAPASALYAFEYARSACDQNDAAGCYLQGLAYLRGSPVPRDPGRAAALLERACRDKEGRACAQVARLLEQGDGAGVPRDEKRAAELGLAGCGQGDADSCFLAARLSPADRVALVERGCATRPAAAECFVELRPGEEPVGCRRDPDAPRCDAGMAKTEIGPENLNTFQTACQTSTGRETCLKLGRMYMAPRAHAKPDLPKALAYLRLGCDHGNGPSCMTLAAFHESGEAGVEESAMRALGLYRSACRLSVGEACFHAARLLRRAGDLAAAEATARQACGLGFTPACGR